jgi:hypothetical protein
MGFAPESRRVRAAAPFTPLLCAAPAIFGGAGRYVTPPSPAPYCTLTPPFAPCPPFVHKQGSCRSHAGAGPPPYSPPLRSPRRLRGRRKVRDPSFCPRPLLHADPPPPPFVPCPPFVRVQTGFVPTQGHGRRPSPLHSPRRLRGRGKVCAFAPRRPGSDDDHDDADDKAPTTTGMRRQ